jgi:pimeloyl-ACP methyl ester carboxylesterase
MIPMVIADEHRQLCVSHIIASSRCIGKRPRTLLLHGNPADMDDWRVLAPLLSEHADLAAIDLPGFGRSDDLGAKPRQSLLDLFALSAKTAVDQLGWGDPFFLVGHSHGGGVAQAFAARYPEQIAGIVLIATLGSPAHRAYKQLALPAVENLLRLASTIVRFRGVQPLLRALIGGIMRPMFYPSPVPSERIEEQIRAFEARPEILVNMARLTRGKPCEQLGRDAECIRSPVLFIHGDSDQIVPMVHAESIHSIVSSRVQSSFCVVAGGGHMLHTTHAEEVHRLIASWFAKCGTQQ